MAIATMASTAFSVHKSNQMIGAANKARKSGIDQAIANQDKIAKEGFQARREAAGTILGGSPSGAAVSEQGTVLTKAQEKKSLLG